MLPGPRHERFDGTSARRCDEDRIRPELAGGSATWPSSKETPLVCLRVTRDRAQHAPETEPSALEVGLRLARTSQAQGETHSPPCCTNWPRQSASGRDHHYLGPVRRAGAAPAVLPAPAIPPSRRRGLSSARPAGIRLRVSPAMRFLDMEGGPAIFADPNEIADRYHKALRPI